MTKFTSRATTLQLTLAAAVLWPMAAFAETPMTARQMLAHAQTQALNVPGDIKKPELDRSEKITSASIAAPVETTAIAAPLPVIEPPAPIAPPSATLTAVPAPVIAPEAASPQLRANAVVAAAPTADIVKASNTTPVAPPVVANTVAPPPAVPATPPAATVAAPAPASPTAAAPAASAAPPSRAQAVAVAPSTKSPTPEKTVQAQRQPTPTSAAPAHPARKPAARSSARGTETSVETQIARIMRRPEVQSLMSQYGLE
ncbi:conserved protein of unknown function [Bradyrhizobium sp. ORS 285]|uniref:hypothetical protein n=1 Tax=Bradyrhizobium sp. ORS 285 TaxID=115808 RepID=UPI0002409AAD|nr:hypothetical protein [Bradyrhizobium sp. ORS 285]CCD88138.1 conserved hypothetical protein [Bradyrhizobium sp. ORS 285]SMX58881.1 conserved protein of unknown function [Bradyrhizobium sp. ORS 285]